MTREEKMAAAWEQLDKARRRFEVAWEQRMIYPEGVQQAVARVRIARERYNLLYGAGEG